MTECDEVARVIAAGFSLPADLTMDEARQIVRFKMPDESVQVIDNVAWSLYRDRSRRGSTS